MGEINSITFNGVNSLTHKLYVSGDRAFNSAEKDYEKFSVPGKNGDLLVYNNRFKNANAPYRALIFEDYAINADEVRAWLLSANGYRRLEDTYNPNYFRLASFQGPIDFDTTLLQVGETDLIFDCKPERWLKSGEQTVTFVGNGIITNPTLFNAKPLIRVYGTGTFSIGTGVFNIITAGTNYIDVDCDVLDCYEGATNRNENVSITEWAELVPGSNGVALGIGITKIEVIPRWWTV